MEPSTDDLIPTRLAASIVRRRSSTIAKWVEAGRLTPVLRGTGKRGAMWFLRADLEAIAAEEDAKYVLPDDEPAEASA